MARNAGLLFIALAVAAAVFAFGGFVIGALAWIARALLLVFLVLAVVSFMRKNAV